MLDVAKIFFVGESSRCSANSSDSDFLPAGNVQYQFPDAVAFRDGTCSSGFGVYSVENFHECRTVPSFAVEGALELVNYEIDLRHVRFSSREKKILTACYSASVHRGFLCDLISNENDRGTVGGNNHCVSIQQETLARIHSETPRARFLHDFNCFYTDHRDIEPHVL